MLYQKWLAGKGTSKGDLYSLTFSYNHNFESLCHAWRKSIRCYWASNINNYSMKKYYIPILIVIFLLNSSLSCETCYEYPNTKLGDTRNWLPIQGRTSLQFVTDNGSIRSFPIIETDTILKESNCVPTELKYRTALKLNDWRNAVYGVVRVSILNPSPIKLLLGNTSEIVMATFEAMESTDVMK